MEEDKELIFGKVSGVIKIKENNLKGHLRSNSIIMCQMIFTSDQAFFDNIGEKETNQEYINLIKESFKY